MEWQFMLISKPIVLNIDVTYLYHRCHYHTVHKTFRTNWWHLHHHIRIRVSAWSCNRHLFHPDNLKLLQDIKSLLWDIEIILMQTFYQKYLFRNIPSWIVQDPQPFALTLQYAPSTQQSIIGSSSRAQVCPTFLHFSGVKQVQLKFYDKW